jgi:sterol desaturase/sphingolipid hydroxylase (fatty acid hydroxylase superfamily)
MPESAVMELIWAWFKLEPQTLWFISYWAVLAAFAWLETIAPAFHEPAQRGRRWPTNIGMGVANSLLVSLAPVSALLAAQWAHANNWGLLNVLGGPWWLALIATFGIRSFAGYVFHVVMHKVHAFWRLHRVHHSDVHLDVTTTVRLHPVEAIAQLFTLGPLAVLFGFDPWALVAYEITDNFIGLASHTNWRLPDRVDRVLRWVFVTPNMHSLHHSSYVPETDSNYGQVFSIWDRLFGTYTAAPRGGFDAMQIGLEEIRDDRASDFWWVMKSPALRTMRE